MPIYGEPEHPYPEAYTKGVWLFNHGHFFECHEILEELWLESIATPKLFYQMLIHAAVCFVHWENGNRRGVLSLSRTFRQKLEKIPADTYMGLDLVALKEDMAAIVDPLRVDDDQPLPEFEKLVPPLIAVKGFEPAEVDDEELLRLGRH